MTFAIGDATDPAVALDGTVFFLYAPFNGAMLARMVARLERIATQRPITVATVGVTMPASSFVTRATSCPTLAFHRRAHPPR